jgi:hypothetical protein
MIGAHPMIVTVIVAAPRSCVSMGHAKFVSVSNGMQVIKPRAGSHKEEWQRQGSWKRSALPMMLDNHDGELLSLDIRLQIIRKIRE